MRRAIALELKIERTTTNMALDSRASSFGSNRHYYNGTSKFEGQGKFDKPKSGQFAVKVLNHFGAEVMKVFRVE